MALAEDRPLAPLGQRGGVRSSESISIQTVIGAGNGAEFGPEVPASLFRLQPRSIAGYSFWRMEVAVEPDHQGHITSDHVLVVARHPYTTLWSCLARFRHGGQVSLNIPSTITSLERLQAYVDHDLAHDPWEQGDNLVAGISLPAAALDVGTDSTWGDGYLFGACVNPDGLEEAIVRALRVTPIIAWADSGQFSPATSLVGKSEELARRNILLQVAIRLALAGPKRMDLLASRAVSHLAESIFGELGSSYDADLLDLQDSLSLAWGSARRFHVDLPSALQQMRVAQGRGRLMYKCTEPGVLVPEYGPLPAPVTKGQILTQLRSLTLCSTDISNLYGALGHGHADAVVLGHENCNLVLESQVDGIDAGSFVVPLGDDWLGLAEYEVFRPILPEHDPADVPLSYESRGTYFDPDSRQHVKAVCVVPEWRSGISLIEPLTHVYTYFVTSRGASMARTVVVLGAGACGLFFCLFIRLLGAAKHVAVIDVMPERLARAKDLGLADSTWNPLTDGDACAALVTDTRGAYADVVFDALPGRLPENSPETRRLGMQLLRPQGEYIMYSAARDTTLPTIEMLAKGPRFHFAPYDSRVIDFTQRAQLMRRVLAMIQHGQIKPQDYISRQVNFYSERDVINLFQEYGRTAEVKVEILAKRFDADSLV